MKSFSRTTAKPIDASVLHAGVDCLTLPQWLKQQSIALVVSLFLESRARNHHDLKIRTFLTRSSPTWSKSLLGRRFELIGLGMFLMGRSAGWIAL
jgi:hypothetical protein